MACTVERGTGLLAWARVAAATAAPSPWQVPPEKTSATTLHHSRLVSPRARRPLAVSDAFRLFLVINLTHRASSFRLASSGRSVSVLSVPPIPSDQPNLSFPSRTKAFGNHPPLVCCDAVSDVFEQPTQRCQALAGPHWDPNRAGQQRKHLSQEVLTHRGVSRGPGFRALPAHRLKQRAPAQVQNWHRQRPR